MTSSPTEPQLKVAGSPESEIELLRQKVARLEELVAQLMNRPAPVVYQPYPVPGTAMPGMPLTVTSSGVTPPFQSFTNVCSSATAAPPGSYLTLVPQ